jgi:hypothetical protein
VAAAVVCGGGVAGCTTSHHAVPAPILPCAVSGIHVVAAAGATHHDAAAATAALHLPPTSTVVTVGAAVVVDPLATKVGLPEGSRPMWVVLTTQPPATHPGISGPAPLPDAPTRTLRLVDDETLKPGGTFTCPAVSPATTP